MKKTQLIVALDFDNIENALTVVDELGDNVLWYKVGKEIFTLSGKKIVEELKNRGKKVFLDLKFHDIPRTASKAVRAAILIGADMVNFHSSGGKRMMQTIVNDNQTPKVFLVAVTVLTSFNINELRSVGYTKEIQEQVVLLAKLAQKCGVHGVVCSAWEIDALRQSCGKNFTLIVPGIRPKLSNQDDQVRIMTPKEASSKGADFIVIGRPITQAENRLEATKSILQELQ